MRKGLLLLSLVLLLILSACGETQPPPISPIAPPTATPSDLVPTPTPYAGPINPLTGLPTDEAHQATRPVAVMLNNLREAVPQQGNSQADIIYEALAEGGITRMIGLYQSMEGVGIVGSVRSARPYYLELALGHDAVYMHAGGSDEAYEKIKTWGVTALDCVRTGSYSSVLWRDKKRIQKFGSTHSVVTSGDAITEHFPDYSFRKDHDEGYRYPIAFLPDGTPTGGTAASSVTVPFSSYKTGVFTYSNETKQYAIEQYGKPYTDMNTDTQVSVTNVIIIQTDCHTIDDYGRMSVDLTSGGKGYYANGGQMIPITWSKASRNEPLLYYNEAGTDAISLGQGHSYVCIVPLSTVVAAE